MNKYQVKKYTLAVALFLSALVIFSQENPAQKKDLKIGVVLSGGGAKGLAHIGVLKVLEDAGVRIDYIGGTSMGAMVGALYASGYSANDIDSITRSLNFDKLIQDELPRRSKSVYQKENTEKYALTLPLAVSKGQNITNTLSKLTEHVHNVSDFSKLQVPFYCIATDLESGEAVILDKGYLPEAVRASGAFPTLFDPVRINDRLLTDGGVVDNFPIDIMKQKGMDIIIGVDVQDRLHVRKDLKSAMRILMQIINFQMYDATAANREGSDLYLHPDIAEYTVVSFDMANEIIDSGVEVAEKQWDYLKNLASLQDHSKPVTHHKLTLSKDRQFTADKIEVLGSTHYTREYILSKIRVFEGEPITYDKFYEGIDNLSATGNFKNIQYKFITSNNKPTLVLDITEEEIATDLQFSAHYDDLYKTGILVNVTSKHALFDNDVLSADLVLGDHIRSSLDYFIDNGFHWSYGVKSRYNNFSRSFFENAIDEISPQGIAVKKIPVKYHDFTTQLFVQTEFNRNLAFRIGAEQKYLKIFYESFLDNVSSKIFLDNTNYVNAFSGIILDTYDDKNFPERGLFLTADFNTYLFASGFRSDFKPFSQVKGKLSGAFTFGNFTTQIISEAGITIGDASRVFYYFLGGNNQNFINNFTDFYGYDVADLSESAFLKSAIVFRYQLFKKHYLTALANIARAENNLFNKGSIFENTKTGYAVGYSIKSFIGPIELKYAWTPDNKRNYWYINVGFWF